MDLSEKNFEQAIEETLLAGEPDARGVVAEATPGPFGKFAPRGYRKRKA